MPPPPQPIYLRDAIDAFKKTELILCFFFLSSSDPGTEGQWTGWEVGIREENKVQGEFKIGIISLNV